MFQVDFEPSPDLENEAAKKVGLTGICTGVTWSHVRSLWVFCGPVSH